MDQDVQERPQVGWIDIRRLQEHGMNYLCPPPPVGMVLGTTGLRPDHVDELQLGCLSTTNTTWPS